MKEKTCLALYSGGLDSLLAVRVMQNQGINVVVLNFDTGFFFGAYDIIDGKSVFKTKSPYEVNVVDISKDFFEMIKKPVHGFGKHMNPCIDCKILMLKKAKELMAEYDAGFVVTGEVLGQRPMSQNAARLRTIENDSGLEGFLLRPLCAKNMPETEPEKLGWVQRGKLLDLQGRGRTKQLELAKLWGIKEFVSTPAGGCILTEENFSKRLKDFLFVHQESSVKREDMLLLRLGRHFRIDEIKFVAGRNKKENEALIKYTDKGIIFDTKDAPGPITVAIGSPDAAKKRLIAEITAGYSDARDKHEAEVEITEAGQTQTIKVQPMNPKDARKYRIDL